VGWEQRRGSGAYYTRSRKVAGRVVREYVGTGPAAELAAAIDELARHERRSVARSWSTMRKLLALAFQKLVVYSQGVDRLATEALQAAGYYRHDRGPWRIRRMPRTDQQLSPDSNEVFDGLVHRIMTGDSRVAPKLVAHAKADPDAWRQVGDLGRQAMEAVILLAVGTDTQLAESILKKAAEIESDAAGPNPTPLAALLAQRVAATWLSCHHADFMLLKARQAGVSDAKIAYLQRSQERAQRLYLQAAKTAASVKKLLSTDRPIPRTTPKAVNDELELIGIDLPSQGDSDKRSGSTGSRPARIRQKRSRRERMRQEA
jgi:hypothetical protein